MPTVMARVGATRNKAKLYLQDHPDMTQTAAARSMGLSSTTLSLFLKDDYKGNSEEIAAKVAAWLERQEERKHALPRPKFVETSIAGQIHSTLKYCHAQQEFGVIVGRSGLGKTMALDEYAARQKDVVLIKVNVTHTPLRFMEDLARQAKVQFPRGTMHGLLNRTVEKLRDTNRLVIIDEAQFLQVRAIEAVRALYDEAHIGVALVGMPRLYHSAINSGTEFLAQIAQRVGTKLVLSQLSEADLRMILGMVQPGLSDAAVKTAYQLSEGGARIAMKLMKKAVTRSAAARKSVTPQDLLWAQQSLYSVDETRPKESAGPVHEMPDRQPAAPARRLEATG